MPMTLYRVPESGDHPLVLLLEVAFALALAISIVLLRGAWLAEGLDALLRVAVWALLAVVTFPALGVGLLLARLTGGSIGLTPEALHLEGAFGRWHTIPRTAVTITPLPFHLLERGLSRDEGTVAWAVEMQGLPPVYGLTKLAYPRIDGRAFIITHHHSEHKQLLGALQFDNTPPHVISSSSV